MSTGVSTDQGSDPAPVPVDAAPRRNTQVGGTQTSPPPQHRSDTVAGCTQTTPPQNRCQDNEPQGQPDHNQVSKDNQKACTSGEPGNKGTKGKKKLSQDTTPHPGMSQGMDTVPRSNFTSRKPWNRQTCHPVHSM